MGVAYPAAARSPAPRPRQDGDLTACTGLRVLLSLRNDARRDGQRLVLIPGPLAVDRIFALTATRALFDWRDR